MSAILEAVQTSHVDGNEVFNLAANLAYVRCRPASTFGNVYYQIPEKVKIETSRVSSVAGDIDGYGLIKD